VKAGAGFKDPTIPSHMLSLSEFAGKLNAPGEPMVAARQDLVIQPPSIGAIIDGEPGAAGRMKQPEQKEQPRGSTSRFPARTKPLSPDEEKRKAAQEKDAHDGKRSGLKHVRALAIIRKEGLYRPEKNYPVYCLKEYRHAEATANLYAQSGEALLAIEATNVAYYPESESQLRPLHGLENHQVVLVWKETITMHGPGGVNERTVCEVRDRIISRPPKKPVSEEDANRKMEKAIRNRYLKRPDDQQRKFIESVRRVCDQLDGAATAQPQAPSAEQSKSAPVALESVLQLARSTGIPDTQIKLARVAPATEPGGHDYLVLSLHTTILRFEALCQKLEKAMPKLPYAYDSENSLKPAGSSANRCCLWLKRLPSEDAKPAALETTAVLAAQPDAAKVEPEKPTVSPTTEKGGPDASVALPVGDKVPRVEDGPIERKTKGGKKRSPPVPGGLRARRRGIKSSAQPEPKRKGKIQEQHGSVARAADEGNDTIDQRAKDAQGAAPGTNRGKSRPAAALQIAGNTKRRPANADDERLLPEINEIRRSGVTSLGGIARCLNELGHKTPNGKAFFAQTVKNLVLRTAAR